MTFSQNFACPEHGISIERPVAPACSPSTTRWAPAKNAPALVPLCGWTRSCILPNRSLSIREGAIKASGWYYAEGSVSEMYYIGLGKKYGFTLDTPIKDMSTEAVNALLYGTNGEKIEMHRETDEFGSGGVLQHRFEGIVEQSGAPLPRDEQRVDEGGDRQLYVRRGVPGLPRTPPEAGGAGRDHRATRTSASSARCPSGTSWNLSSKTSRTSPKSSSRSAARS